MVGAVMARGLALTGAALALGVPAAVLVTRSIRDFLYEVTPRDPAVFLVAALLAIGTAAFASFLPARRAARVDPTAALRAESADDAERVAPAGLPAVGEEGAGSGGG